MCALTPRWSGRVGDKAHTSAGAPRNSTVRHHEKAHSFSAREEGPKLRQGPTQRLCQIAKHCAPRDLEAQDRGEPSLSKCDSRGNDEGASCSPRSRRSRCLYRTHRDNGLAQGRGYIACHASGEQDRITPQPRDGIERQGIGILVGGA
jgi:hypothetical protein